MKSLLLALVESRRKEYIAAEGAREYSCLWWAISYGDIKTIEELSEYMDIE